MVCRFKKIMVGPTPRVPKRVLQSKIFGKIGKKIGLQRFQILPNLLAFGKAKLCARKVTDNSSAVYLPRVSFPDVGPICFSFSISLIS